MAVSLKNNLAEFAAFLQPKFSTICVDLFCRHVDGNHKLIKWKFIIHGGKIDILYYSLCM